MRRIHAVIGLLGLALIAALAGCAGEAHGPMFLLTNLPAPSPGAAQLVFYRLNKFAGAGRAADVVVNGSPTCELLRNGAFVYGVPPGPVKVEMSHWDSPGTSELTFDVASGGIYYVRVETDEGKVWTGAAAGLLGRLIAEGVSSNKGPYVMRLVERSQAEPELAPVRMAPCDRGPQPVAAN